MKVLLVMPHPHTRRSMFARFTYPSLTMQQLAAITPPEHEVQIVDERFEDVPVRADYDVVAMTSLTYNSIRGYELADQFRSQGIPVVAGGYHASLLPDEAKQHADAVVIGEAELTWPRVLNDIANHTLKPFYRAERLVEPQEIPAARHDIGAYNPFAEAMQASRGCPTGCEFCAMQIVEGNRFRARPVDHLVDEAQSIKSRLIFFTDASLTISPPFSKTLFKALTPLNKHFDCFGNINVLSRDDELLRYAAEAGFSMWYVGIESISQENINAAGKSTNKVEEYGKAIRKIKEHGMLVTGFLMFGFDYDTPETFQRTLSAINEWDLDGISLSIMTPYPGTRLYQRMEQEGRITCKDWSRYTEGNLNYNLQKLSEEQLFEGIQQIAKDYFSYRRILKRSLFHNGKLTTPYRFISKFTGNIISRMFSRSEKYEYLFPHGHADE
ncbi:MAG TPA: radical SAM protein [Candidatus Thermoplasmatota archaeon]|nr:radical SAM protein [Candidatus Thermoplasmatota archaeon]